MAARTHEENINYKKFDIWNQLFIKLFAKVSKFESLVREIYHSYRTRNKQRTLRLGSANISGINRIAPFLQRNIKLDQGGQKPIESSKGRVHSSRSINCSRHKIHFYEGKTYFADELGEFICLRSSYTHLTQFLEVVTRWVGSGKASDKIQAYSNSDKHRGATYTLLELGPFRWVLDFLKYQLYL